MNKLENDELPQPRNPNFAKVREDLLGEKEFRDNVPIGEDIMKASGIEDKTQCRDTETCQVLNEFLDNGYGVPKTLSFNMSSMDNWMNMSISMEGMGVRERGDFQFRVMQFVINEINRIKNAN